MDVKVEGSAVEVKIGEKAVKVIVNGGNIEKMVSMENNGNAVVSITIKEPQEGKTYGLTVEWDEQEGRGAIHLSGPFGEWEKVIDLASGEGEKKCIGPVCVELA